MKFICSRDAVTRFYDYSNGKLEMHCSEEFFTSPSTKQIFMNCSYYFGIFIFFWEIFFVENICRVSLIARLLLILKGYLWN